MRVSTSQIFNSGTNGIQNRQYDLYRTQNQLSTGRRILTPKDDPIGASEVLKYSQSKGVNEQFLDNQSNATAKLSFLETILASVSDELGAIHERAVEAGNASYSDSERGMIAAELKNRLQNLIGLANTQDGTGRYIFGGFQSSSKPFSGVDTVTYNGDAGSEAIQITASQVMTTGNNGLEVFMQVRDRDGEIVGRDIFESLNKLIDTLDPNRGPAYSAADQAEAVSDFSAAINHVATIRATVGARLQALESLGSVGEDLSLQYDSRISELQDLDYTEAISRLANYKLQLEAAQLSFKEISQLSLFNIL